MLKNSFCCECSLCAAKAWNRPAVQIEHKRSPAVPLAGTIWENLWVDLLLGRIRLHRKFRVEFSPTANWLNHQKWASTVCSGNLQSVSDVSVRLLAHQPTLTANLRLFAVQSNTPLDYVSSVLGISPNGPTNNWPSTASETGPGPIHRCFNVVSSLVCSRRTPWSLLPVHPCAPVQSLVLLCQHFATFSNRAIVGIPVEWSVRTSQNAAHDFDSSGVTELSHWNDWLQNKTPHTRY